MLKQSNVWDDCAATAIDKTPNISKYLGNHHTHTHIHTHEKKIEEKQIHA